MKKAHSLTSFMKHFSEMHAKAFYAVNGMLLCLHEGRQHLLVYNVDNGSMEYHRPTVISGGSHTQTVQVDMTTEMHVFRIDNTSRFELYLSNHRSGLSPNYVTMVTVDALNENAEHYEIDAVTQPDAWQTAVEAIEEYEEVIK